MALNKVQKRERIKRRVRGKISGSAELPRLSVYKSNKEIYAQLVDDKDGKTLASASSRGLNASGTKVEISAEVGKAIAEKAKAAGIENIVFDRNGFVYHGRVKALADGAREGGLNSNHKISENMLGLDNIEKVKPGGLELKDRLVAVNRVTKVTKGGRAFGFSAIVVVGDEAGVIGFGLGKSKEVATAISKAVEDAKKNLVKVPLTKDGTIYHETTARYGGADVFMRPASHGTGVIAGNTVRIVVESAGIKDILTKSKGSSNPHNVVKATFKALLDIRTPEEIARMRGVSLDKVFKH